MPAVLSSQTELNSLFLNVTAHFGVFFAQPSMAMVAQGEALVKPQQIHHRNGNALLRVLDAPPPHFSFEC